ncbi:MAG: hypothetical protein JWR19_2196 [Pedosphaera sp.]|nr:hypothetical protein [Pedosphaera sp.]
MLPAHSQNLMKTRQQIIQSARKQRIEIQQLFIDVEHWNTAVRPETEAKIDADPDGKMKQIADALDQMLLKEDGHVGLNREQWIAAIKDVAQKKHSFTKYGIENTGLDTFWETYGVDGYSPEEALHEDFSNG